MYFYKNAGNHALSDTKYVSGEKALKMKNQRFQDRREFAIAK